MTCFEAARNENIYDAAAAQFTIHVTMDVCSASPTVKGCLDVEENTSTEHHTLHHQMALPAGERTSRRPELQSAVDMELCT